MITFASVPGEDADDARHDGDLSTPLPLRRRLGRLIGGRVVDRQLFERSEQPGRS